MTSMIDLKSVSKLNSTCTVVTHNIDTLGKVIIEKKSDLVFLISSFHVELFLK